MPPSPRLTRLLPVSALTAASALLLLILTPTLGAQGGPSAAFPPAPVATVPAGTLSGQVVDPAGALVPGATVRLNPSSGAPGQLATTDAEGRFHFSALSPGEYVINLRAPGFEAFTSAAVSLRPGQAAPALTVTLAVETNHADLTVTLSRHELANDEIHAAEGQRVLGLFPNFYTSFVPNPAPLDTGQKFLLAVRATTDRMAFVTAALVASGEQINKTFPRYGSGPTGYLKRYGAAYADGFIGKFVGAAVLPSLFRQDPRYFYRGTGTLRQRGRHALLSAVLARGDNGRLQPNYSHILGNAAAGAISATYHPASDSAGKLALDNALIGIAGGAAVNLTREFLLRPFTHGVPPMP